VKVKWVVSFISCTDDMRQTIRGIGIAQNASGGRARGYAVSGGMIHKVRHLVEVVNRENGEKSFQGPQTSKMTAAPKPANKSASRR